MYIQIYKDMCMSFPHTFLIIHWYNKVVVLRQNKYKIKTL